nr:hypothetical protein [Dickeya chrysanthemi]MCA7009740.1 hypothetical protein [Dickeya chrysanthemi]
MTYQEITRVTTERIESFMTDSARKSSNEAVSRLYQEWAVGAFFLWSDITGDKKTSEDEARLSKLVGLS